MLAEKLNYFLLDSSATAKDSVIALLQNNPNGIENADVLLTYAYINKNDYNSALQNITAIAGKKGDWANLQTQLISLYQSQNKAFALNTNVLAKNAIETVAATEGIDGRGAAQAILKFVKGQNYFIPHLIPLVEGGVNKSINNALANDDNNGNAEFNIYPNPASNVINFTYKGSSEKAFITLSNTLGTVVYQAPVKPNSKTEIALDNFLTGVYLLTANNGKVKVYQSKVVKIN